MTEKWDIVFYPEGGRTVTVHETLDPDSFEELMKELDR